PALRVEPSAPSRDTLQAAQWFVWSLLGFLPPRRRKLGGDCSRCARGPGSSPRSRCPVGAAKLSCSASCPLVVREHSMPDGLRHFGLWLEYESMDTILGFLLSLAQGMLRSQADLALENAAWGQQPGTYLRPGKRPKSRPTDRALWVVLRWIWPRWRSSL